MATSEDSHWWYRALRDALTGVLGQSRFRLRDDMRALDAGCGTGANLQHLAQLYPAARLSGFDYSELAIQFARVKVPEADLYLSDLRHPDLRGDPVDLIVSFDVIAVPGLAAVRPGLERLVGHLRPGGLFIVHVPAYQWLLSDHDMACHQYERYAPADIRRLLTELGLTVEFLTHRVAGPFPLLVATRLPSILGHRKAPDTARSQVRVSSAVVNTVLGGMMRGENLLIRRGWRMPWGSSLLAVGRKPTPSPSTP